MISSLFVDTTIENIFLIFNEHEKIQYVTLERTYRKIDTTPNLKYETPPILRYYPKISKFCNTVLPSKQNFKFTKIVSDLSNRSAHLKDKE